MAVWWLRPAYVLPASQQERATNISHANTARLASYHGDNALTKVCGLIAADEGRHESESLTLAWQHAALHRHGQTVSKPGARWAGCSRVQTQGEGPFDGWLECLGACMAC